MGSTVGTVDPWITRVITFSLAPFQVRIQYAIHITCKMCVNRLFVIVKASSQQWAISSWVLGESEVICGFVTCGVQNRNQGSPVHTKHFLLHAESLMVVLRVSTHDFELQTELASSFLWNTTFVCKDNWQTNHRYSDLSTWQTFS